MALAAAFFFGAFGAFAVVSLRPGAASSLAAFFALFFAARLGLPGLVPIFSARAAISCSAWSSESEPGSIELGIVALTLPSFT